jgi:hypothetical protein
MDLIVPFVAALLGMSAAFFLVIGVHDLLPEGWLLRVGRGRTGAALDALAMARRPLIPRTIRHTPLD